MNQNEKQVPGSVCGDWIEWNIINMDDQPNGTCVAT